MGTHDCRETLVSRTAVRLIVVGFSVGLDSTGFLMSSNGTGNFRKIVFHLSFPWNLKPCKDCEKIQFDEIINGNTLNSFEIKRNYFMSILEIGSPPGLVDTSQCGQLILHLQTKQFKSTGKCNVYCL